MKSPINFRVNSPFWVFSLIAIVIIMVFCLLFFTTKHYPIKQEIDKTPLPELSTRSKNIIKLKEKAIQETLNINDSTSLMTNEIHPTKNIFNVKSGSLSVWLKFAKDKPRRDHIIFSTDDSRYVLFVDTYSSSTRTESIMRIGARAGGNSKVVDSSYKGGNFPEASIVVDNDGSLRDYGSSHSKSTSLPVPEDEWHHVTMTWNGYPEGNVRIYLNGKLAGEKLYDSRYDNGLPLPTSVAIGFRPRTWSGELIQKNNEIIKHLVPNTNMSLGNGSIDINDLRLYTKAITQEQISQIIKKSQDQLPKTSELSIKQSKRQVQIPVKKKKHMVKDEPKQEVDTYNYVKLSEENRTNPKAAKFLAQLFIVLNSVKITFSEYVTSMVEFPKKSSTNEIK